MTQTSNPQLTRRNGYARVQEIAQEKAARENGQGQEKKWVENFVDMRPDRDGLSVRVRFLYNVPDMLVFRMHDYWDPTARRFVRALCAQEYGLECHWCNVAQPFKDRADALPRDDKKARKAAWDAYYEKSAKETFILPCFVKPIVKVNKVDAAGAPIYDANGDPVMVERLGDPVPKLLALKRGVRVDLVDAYEKGIDIEGEDGSISKLHDITKGDFIIKKTGTGTDTTYGASFTRVSPFNFTPPTFERIEKMILECRPYKVATGGVVAQAEGVAAGVWNGGDDADLPF